jgi:hypothetical protein
MKLIPDKGVISDKIEYSIEYLGSDRLVLPKYAAKIKFIESDNTLSSAERAFIILNDIINTGYSYIHSEYNRETEVLKIYHRDLIELKILLDAFIIRYLGLEYINIIEYSDIKDVLNRITDIMWYNDILISELKLANSITCDKITICVNSDLVNTGDLETYELNNSTVIQCVANTISKLIHDYSHDDTYYLIDSNDIKDTLKEVYYYVAALYNHILNNK